VLISHRAQGSLVSDALQDHCIYKTQTTCIKKKSFHGSQTVLISHRAQGSLVSDDLYFNPVKTSGELKPDCVPSCGLSLLSGY